MTILYVQGKINATGTTVTLSTAATTGNALCVSVFISGVTTATVGVTDNATGGSNTYTAPSAGSTAGGGANSIYQFFATNVHGSPTVLSATTSAGTVAGVVVDEFSGIATSAAGDGGAAAFISHVGTGTNAVTSGAFVPTTNGDLVWAVDWDNAAITAGTGFTQGQFDSTDDIMTENLIQATAASIAGTFTHASSQDVWVAAMALKAAAGGDTFAVDGARLIFM